MLGADPRVVEPGRDRVRVCDLSVRVGEDGRARPVQDAGATRAQRRRPRRFDPDQAHVLVVEERCEHTDRVRASADAGDDGLRERALRLEELSPCLAADHRLELTHELRVRGRAHARADHVVRRLDVRDPVADRRARRLLQRPRAGFDRFHGGAEELHPLHVGRLAAHVLRPHVHDALEPEARARRGGRDAVLSRARLRDDPSLAEAQRKDDLAQRVVDLVRPRVVQVLPLQVQPLPWREAAGERDRRGPPDVGAPELIELRQKSRVAPRYFPGGGQLVERRDQRLRDVPTPVLAEGLLVPLAGVRSRRAKPGSATA